MITELDLISLRPFYRTIISVNNDYHFVSFKKKQSLVITQITAYNLSIVISVSSSRTLAIVNIISNIIFPIVGQCFKTWPKMVILVRSIRL